MDRTGKFLLLLGILASLAVVAPAAADHCNIGQTHTCTPEQHSANAKPQIGIARLKTYEWCDHLTPGNGCPFHINWPPSPVPEGEISPENMPAALAKMAVWNQQMNEVAVSAGLLDQTAQSYPYDFYQRCGGGGGWVWTQYETNPPYDGEWGSLTYAICDMQMYFIRADQRIYINNEQISYRNTWKFNSDHSGIETDGDECRFDTCRGNWYNVHGEQIILPDYWYWSNWIVGCDRYAQSELYPRELKCQWGESYWVPRGSNN